MQATEQTPEPKPQRIFHPVKQKEILQVWLNCVKGLLGMAMLPRVMISIRVEDMETKQFQLNVTYPGLTHRQALPLIVASAEAVNQKIQAEERKSSKILRPS